LAFGLLFTEQLGYIFSVRLFTVYFLGVIMDSSIHFNFFFGNSNFVLNATVIEIHDLAGGVL